jgi:hypothetical protein
VGASCGELGAGLVARALNTIQLDRRPLNAA